MYYIGVDLGGTNIAIGIVNEEFEIVKKGSTPTKPERGADAIVADMAALSHKLLEEMGLTLDDVVSAGVATPGTANNETGVVEYANNIPFLQYPLADKLSALLDGKPVYIENDANAAAKAEAMAGVAKGAPYSVMITLGTGLGGGIVINGKVYSGFNFAGAELGHIVIEKDGRQCSCGRKGCWEAYSSATALINFTKEKMAQTKDTLMWELCENGAKKVSGRTAFKAAKAGDKAGQEVVDTYIDYLACGITNMVNIFQPEVLCIGGGVCGEGDYLLEPLKAIVDRDQYGSAAHDDKTQIKIAELGNDAGILGAALLGI